MQYKHEEECLFNKNTLCCEQARICVSLIWKGVLLAWFINYCLYKTSFKQTLSWQSKKVYNHILKKIIYFACLTVPPLYLFTITQSTHW